MKMHALSRRCAAALTFSMCVLAFAAALAQAQEYPNKPITLVVPFEPGSGTDQSARVYAQAVSDYLKVPVVIDNRGGASGAIGAQTVARAAPDGYTVFMTTNTTQVANPSLFKKLNYDPVKDFAPVALLSKGQMLLLVRPDSPYQSLADLLDAARKSPGKLSFGSGSSSSLVASELLRQMANLYVLSVPYKSNPQAIIDLIGGQIDFMFADATTSVPQVQSGKLRALAASDVKRLAVTPDVPTVDEAGIKGYAMSYWSAIYVPAGTPDAVIQRLHQAFAHAVQSPEVQTYLEKTSGEVAFGMPAALARFQEEEMAKWARVIQAAGIEPQ